MFGTIPRRDFYNVSWGCHFGRHFIFHSRLYNAITVYGMPTKYWQVMFRFTTISHTVRVILLPGRHVTLIVKSISIAVFVD